MSQRAVAGEAPGGPVPVGSTTARRSPSGPVRTLRRGLGPALPALLAFVAVRATGLAMMWLHPGHGSVLARLAGLWDAPYYQGVAEHGYSDDLGIGGYQNGVPYSSRAFFPLYPACIRAAHTVLPLSYAHAALLVAWCFAVLAAAGIYSFAAYVYKPRTGVIAVVVWAALPYGVVESLAYSEPVFTAFAAWALAAVVRRRWIAAGLLSCLSCLARPSGLAVAAAVAAAAAAEAVRLLRARRPLDPQLPVAVLLAPAGWIGYVAYVGYVRGTPRGYFDVQSAWGSQFDFGRATLRWFTDLTLRQGTATTLAQVVAAGVVAASLVLFVLAVVQRQPLPALVYGGAMLVIALGDGSADAPRARLLLPAFVLLLPVAAGLSRIRSAVSLWVVLGSLAVCSGVYGVHLVYVSGYSP
ncbi:hypothetical protein [Kitasatospora viridis]|uniref:Mannosyltransferase PIG-V n=1 Tax=Kitasatospora viridis TaxID=281105 RepID=A0A561UJL4_9ACTN|nr:hypothetical protein [Kitasatospora viridis]TWF99547.1 hypothetical protein FHX73_113394 [Kitasatospora viridis]